MTVHYKKSGIDLKNFIGFQKYDLDKLLELEHHKFLVKGNNGKGLDLYKTMPLWSKNTDKTI